MNHNNYIESAITQGKKMDRPKMMLKWEDEDAQPISRDVAARVIRGNRRANPALRIHVTRKFGETYIASQPLGVACCVFRAT